MLNESPMVFAWVKRTNNFINFWIEYKQSHLFGPKDIIKILCKVKRNSDTVTIYKSNTLSEFQTLFKIHFLLFAADSMIFSNVIHFDFNPFTNSHTKWTRMKMLLTTLFDHRVVVHLFANKSISFCVHKMCCTMYNELCDSIALDLCIGRCGVLDQREVRCAFCSTYQMRCSCMNYYTFTKR